jgi:hypothetical protein
MSEKERPPGPDDIDLVAMRIAVLENAISQLVTLACSEDAVWSDRLRAEVERQAAEFQEQGEAIIRRLGQLRVG